MLINAVTFLAPLIALALIRIVDMVPDTRQESLGSALSEGILALYRRPPLLGTISLLNCEGSSLGGYRRDIKRLANLGVEALLPGHGGFCLGGGQSHIDEAIDAFRSIWPPSNYR